MRIAQMVDSLQIGGAQKLQVTFAAVARERGVSLTFISLDRDDDQAIPNELRALGARVVHFPARKMRNPRRMLRVAQFLRRERFDILQTHLVSANIVGTITGRLTGTPVVTTLHSAGLDPHEHRGRQQLEWWLMRYGAQRVLGVGYSVAELHRRYLGHKPVDVILNAVVPAPTLSAAERAALRAEMVGSADRPLVIAVGRLAPPKGYPDLLEAFAAVHAARPDVALAIAGGGSLAAELAAQIERLDLAGHAFLLGGRNDVPRLLAASDLLVSSSHWEGLPLGVLEGMAASLPVVATSVGDVPQIVPEGSGLVVPPHQPAQLATALLALLNDPARMERYGAAARAYVNRYHSPSVWFDQLLALYDAARTRRPFVPQPSQETP